MNSIKTRNLTKIFKVGFKGTKMTAVSGLNLRVGEREIFGFLGPNGAGKTTTIKMLMGLIYPTEGEASIFDHPIREVKIKNRVGFLPEHPYFYDYLTGREFLAFYGSLFGIRKRELKRKIGDLLTKVGLAHAADTQLRKFSKGMLQRIGIAQALVNDPDLVVLDEPMSGLDPVGRKEVRDLIFQLRECGKTVFFSSHIIPDVEMICDRVGILLKGALVNVGKLDEILEARVKQIEIVVQGEMNRLASALQPISCDLSRRSDYISITTSDEGQVDDVLREVLNLKGRVISVTPQRETLEEYFMKLASKKS